MNPSYYGRSANIIAPPGCFLIVLLLLAPVFIHAQTTSKAKYTISGYVKDASSGEDLPGANVYLIEAPTLGTTTNVYGFFSMTVPEGNYNLAVSYIGYETWTQAVDLTADIRINVDIIPTGIVTEEVVITGERKDENVLGTEMGTAELSTDEIKAIPALFGEVDVLKTIQLLPGVQSAGEGNSGFYVRGGGPDQNLILLDEAIVYNTGHLFGFFSVFNADAIKNTTLIKGSMPARYGGRLSSVLDISMKEGNNKEFHGTGGIGIISSRLTLEGPLVKEKASFIVSGRRTYADILAKPFLNNTDFEGNGYYFYDLNAKVNYRFSDKDRIYASGYFGRDVFNFKSPDDDFSVEIPWGNATSTIRWNHLFNDRMFMNVSAIYNKYNFEISSVFEDFNFRLFSGVRDYNLKADFDYYPGANHHLRYGVNYTYHTFTPYSANGSQGDTEFSTDSLNQKFANEAAIYLSDEFNIGWRWRINAGVRLSYFEQIGPFRQISYNERQVPTDTTFFSAGERIKQYGGIEPRLGVRYIVNKTSSVKFGISRNIQYTHLVSSSTSTLPTDLWVPSSALVQPQRGIQYSAGYFRNFLDNMYEASVEVYYKDLENQIEYGQSYVPELGRDIEDSFVFGDGESYGAEFFFKKAKGKVNGWIGYTLSYTYRLFDDLNGGERFPAKFDRRHDLSVVAVYDINDRVSLAGTFVYGTGQATTVPVAAYLIEGVIVNEYGGQNAYRLAPYHRMDLSLTVRNKPTANFRSFWNFSVYNIYNRKNPFFIYFDVEGDVQEGSLDVRAKQVSLFPVIPSITWNFEF